MKVNIYCLYDPTSCKIRYIGRTRKSIETRLIEHVTKSQYFSRYFPNKKVSHIANWINSLLNRGVRPRVKLLTIIEGWSESHVFERALIAKYKDRFNLVNSEDRGEGGKNRIVNQEVKNQISNTLKKRHINNEVKKKMSTVYFFNKKGILIGKKESMTAASIFLNCTLKTIDYHLSSNKSVKELYISRFNSLNIDNCLFIYNVSSKETVLFDTQLDIMNFLNISRFIYQSSNNSKVPINDWVINSFSLNSRKKIKLYKEDTEYEFNTVKEASLFIKCNVSAIYSLLKGRIKTVYDFKYVKN